MAALATDFLTWGPQGSPHRLLEAEIKANAALTFFRGALVHIASGTGKGLISNADATEFFGIASKKTVTTAADQAVLCLIRGIVWVSGAANLTDANVGKLMGATAASDNPADIIVQAALNPGAMGRLIAVETTGTKGFIDLDDRSAVVNA